MHNLARALKLYIIERVHNSPRWARLQIIFSDAFVPGEGEHKILEFIRSQRSSVQYDPNTSHCIYGADADLIMLGLSTHEPHFYILRESMAQEKDKKCKRCHKTGHYSHECGNNDQDDPDHKKKLGVVQF
jgi:5'-3' exoribonuclease 2